MCRMANGGAAMGHPVFHCPNTGREIDPGIENAGPSSSAADAARFAALYVRCTHCGEHHEIKIADADLLNAAA